MTPDKPLRYAGSKVGCLGEGCGVKQSHIKQWLDHDNCQSLGNEPFEGREVGVGVDLGPGIEHQSLVRAGPRGGCEDEAIISDDGDFVIGEERIQCRTVCGKDDVKPGEEADDCHQQ